jgi:hypothetical protein
MAAREAIRHVPAHDDPVRPPGRPRRRRVRRLLAVVCLLGLVVVLAGVALTVSLTSRLDRIEGAFDGLPTRPASAPGETIVMVGTRPGGSADVEWLPGQQSIDSVMLVEVDQEGRTVSVGALPQLDGIGPSAASAPPRDLVAAVESWSDRRVDHVMAIDWSTFARLAADNDIDATYRYGSGPDLQLDYLRQVVDGVLHAELRKQPLDLYRALRLTAGGTAVDDGWSALELDLFVLHLRNLRSHEITFSTASSG